MLISCETHGMNPKSTETPQIKSIFITCFITRKPHFYFDIQFILALFLFVWNEGRKNQRGRDRFPICSLIFFPKYLLPPGLAHREAESHSLTLGLPSGWQRINYLNHHLWPPIWAAAGGKDLNPGSLRQVMGIPNRILTVLLIYTHKIYSFLWKLLQRET